MTDGQTAASNTGGPRSDRLAGRNQLGSRFRQVWAVKRLERWEVEFGHAGAGLPRRGRWKRGRNCEGRGRFDGPALLSAGTCWRRAAMIW